MKLFPIPRLRSAESLCIYLKIVQLSRTKKWNCTFFFFAWHICFFLVYLKKSHLPSFLASLASFLASTITKPISLCSRTWATSWKERQAGGWAGLGQKDGRKCHRIVLWCTDKRIFLHMSCYSDQFKWRQRDSVPSSRGKDGLAECWEPKRENVRTRTKTKDLEEYILCHIPSSALRVGELWIWEEKNQKESKEYLDDCGYMTSGQQPFPSHQLALESGGDTKSQCSLCGHLTVPHLNLLSHPWKSQRTPEKLRKPKTKETCVPTTQAQFLSSPGPWACGVGMCTGCVWQIDPRWPLKCSHSPLRGRTRRTLEWNHQPQQVRGCSSVLGGQMAGSYSGHQHRWWLQVWDWHCVNLPETQI